MSIVLIVVRQLLFGLLFIWLVNTSLPGQQINVGTPFSTVSDSFFESFGVNFGFSIPGGHGPGSRVVGYNGLGVTPNINFSQGSFGSTIPAFGGYSPNTGAQFGFSGGGISLGFELAQGSSRTLTSTTPSVTLMNGGIGTISSGAMTPFVTGVIPVVGSSKAIDNAVTRGIASGQLRPYSENRVESNRVESSEPARVSRETSSAASGDISVAEIKAQKALARTLRLQQRDEAIRLAKTAYEDKNYSRSRIELRKAINLTDDESELRKFNKWMKALYKK